MIAPLLLGAAQFCLPSTVLATSAGMAQQVETALEEAGLASRVGVINKGDSLVLVGNVASAADRQVAENRALEAMGIRRVFHSEEDGGLACKQLGYAHFNYRRRSNLRNSQACQDAAVLYNRVLVSDNQQDAGAAE